MHPEPRARGRRRVRRGPRLFGRVRWRRAQDSLPVRSDVLHAMNRRRRRRRTFNLWPSPPTSARRLFHGDEPAAVQLHVARAASPTPSAEHARSSPPRCSPARSVAVRPASGLAAELGPGDGWPRRRRCRARGRRRAMPCARRRAGRARDGAAGTALAAVLPPARRRGSSAAEPARRDFAWARQDRARARLVSAASARGAPARRRRPIAAGGCVVLLPTAAPPPARNATRGSTPSRLPAPPRCPRGPLNGAATDPRPPGEHDAAAFAEHALSALLGFAVSATVRLGDGVRGARRRSRSRSRTRSLRRALRRRSSAAARGGGAGVDRAAFPRAGGARRLAALARERALATRHAREWTRTLLLPPSPRRPRSSRATRATPAAATRPAAGRPVAARARRWIRTSRSTSGERARRVGRGRSDVQGARRARARARCSASTASRSACASSAAAKSAARRAAALALTSRGARAACALAPAARRTPAVAAGGGDGRPRRRRRRRDARSGRSRAQQLLERSAARAPLAAGGAAAEEARGTLDCSRGSRRAATLVPLAPLAAARPPRRARHSAATPKGQHRPASTIGGAPQRAAAGGDGARRRPSRPRRPRRARYALAAADATPRARRRASRPRTRATARVGIVARDFDAVGVELDVVVGGAPVADRRGAVDAASVALAPVATAARRTSRVVALVAAETRAPGRPQTSSRRLVCCARRIAARTRARAKEKPRARCASTRRSIAAALSRAARQARFYSPCGRACRRRRPRRAAASPPDSAAAATRSRRAT